MNRIVISVRIQLVVIMKTNVPISVIVPDTSPTRELLIIVSMLSISLV